MGQVIEQIKKFFIFLKEFWEKQSKKNRIQILISALFVIAVIVLIVFLMNQTRYTILYSGLNADEQVEIEQYLAENENGKYKVDGDVIYVDQANEQAIRMELSNLGHPYSTPNYDFYFNKVGTLTTSEERKLIEEYQLNQRLADVIRTIEGVKSATVTIAYPETSTYVLSSESTEDITAGVTVTLRGGVKLTPVQVKGIQTLVSTSVPGLNINNVSVIDTATGEALSEGVDSSGAVGTSKASSIKRDVEKSYEDDIQGKVRSVLEPIYGQANVRVSVKCDIDIDDSIKEIVTYIPSEDNRGVITKEDLAKALQNEGGTVSGMPGTDTNTEITENEDLTTYPSITVGDNTYYFQDEKSYDYLVSSVKEQVQKKAGKVDNLTVSVILNKESISDSKRQELTTLIANSAAIGSEKVVVYTDLFNTSGGPTYSGDEQPSGNPFDQYPWLIYAVAGAAGLLFIIILLIIIFSKKKKKKKKKSQVAEVETEQSDSESSLTLDADRMEEIQDIKLAKDMVMRQKIQEFSRQNPEIAAQLVKAWLRGDDK